MVKMHPEVFHQPVQVGKFGIGGIVGKYCKHSSFFDPLFDCFYIIGHDVIGSRRLGCGIWIDYYVDIQVFQH